jgi:ParB family transcriptional regulator, chromosome partitioning protein
MDFGDFDIFAAKEEVAQQGRVLSLDPQKVYADPDNVRRAIDQAEIDALAETIGARGQLQPIIVAPADDDGRHMIQFGERRWRACLQLGREVRAIVREVSDPAQVRIDQFIENDQREQLSTRDMIAFVTGQVAAGMSVADLARATGRDRARLSRLHGLASAPDFVAARLDDVPVRAAVALMKAAAHDETGVKGFLDRSPIGSLTVAACEAFARDLGKSPVGERDSGPSVPVIAEPATAVEVGERPKRPGAVHRGEGEAVVTRFIDVDGRRGRLIEALVHFDGEDQARTVRFGS